MPVTSKSLAIHWQVTDKPPRENGGPVAIDRVKAKRAKAMFFLIRMAFWFSLVLLALPLGTGGRDSVGPVQALMAARDAVGDLAGICERKPDVCETGKSAMHTITARAGEAARLAAGLLDEQESAPDTATMTGSVPAKDENGEAAAATELPAEVDIPVRKSNSGK
jgi:hypothetical protein